MSAAADVLPVAAEPPKYVQEGASGVPLAVFAFSVIALSLANAEIVKPGGQPVRPDRVRPLRVRVS